jgi:hypothetical protein
MKITHILNAIGIIITSIFIASCTSTTVIKQTPTLTLTPTLEPLAKMDLLLISKSNGPIQNATVSFQSPSKIEINGNTDLNGETIINILEVGQYPVVFSIKFSDNKVPSYCDSININISNGQTELFPAGWHGKYLPFKLNLDGNEKLVVGLANEDQYYPIEIGDLIKTKISCG